MYKLAKLTVIDDFRSMWEGREVKFSQWLAKETNISVLCDEIGIDIVEIELEASVGSFAVDIKASTTNDKTVIIENQLEQTDHDHLGKIIIGFFLLNHSICIDLLKTNIRSQKINSSIPLLSLLKGKNPYTCIN